MSLSEKKLILTNLENHLKDVLTPNNINAVLQCLSDELDSYSVEQNTRVDDPGDKDLMDAFMTAKRIEGRSDKTIERYRYILSKVFDWVKVPIKSVSVYHLRQYFVAQKDRGISDRTLEGVRSVLCSFYNWTQKEGLIQTNPTTNLSPIKCIKRVKPILTAVDIERLKEGCESDRDKAIVCFLLSTGCRISEATNVDRANIDFQRMCCKVLGKGDKERVVYFDEITAMILKRYLSSRKDFHEALFIGKGSSRMTPGGVRAMLVKLAERTEVEHVHPHRFRRTLATNLINRGMAIQEVAFILGHEKLDTTMKYVYIEEENVKTHYKQCV